MRILFDHDTPWPLRRFLPGHEIDTAAERGWAELRNGALLDRAEREGFDLLLTADQSMRHQQNLAGKRLAVVVLLSNRWPSIQPKLDAVRTALDNAQPGQWTEVEI